MWAASVIVCYVVSLRPLANDPLLSAAWTDAYLPRPLWSYWTVNWLIDSVLTLFGYAAGVNNLAGLFVFAAVVACVGAFRQPMGQKLLIAISPGLLALAAAAVRRYPFQD